MNNPSDLLFEFLEWFSKFNTTMENFSDLYVVYALHRRELLPSNWEKSPYIRSRIDKFHYADQREKRSLEDLVIVKLLTAQVSYPLEDFEIAINLTNTINDPYKWCFWELIYGNLSTPNTLSENIEKELRNLDISNFFQVRLAQLINVGNTLVLPNYTENTFQDIFSCPWKVFLFDKQNQKLSDKINTPLLFTLKNDSGCYLRFQNSQLGVENGKLFFGDIGSEPEIHDENLVLINMFAYRILPEANIYYKFYRNSGGLTVTMFSRSSSIIYERIKTISTYFVDSNIDFENINASTVDTFYWAMVWKTNHATISIPRKEIVYNDKISDLYYQNHVLRIDTSKKSLMLV